ncbi:MAG: carboxypeptidase-like regulatory domain-containing protein [Candidatus Thermoplasmatota archaeon]
MGPKTLLAVLLLTASVLAGCSGGGSDDPVPDEAAEGAPEIVVTETTGGIRGVVVDSAIRPIKGATVEVLSANKTFTTDETGLFAFSGLEAGTYFVKASHPLYDVQQQNVAVAAGVADPAPVKFLLTRVILANPYMTTEKFDGYIVCSQDFSGSLFSEECGEGVGVPCDAAGQPVPPPGCTRVGGQGNNQVQYDFFPGADNVKSLIVELVWEPTIGAATTGALWTIVMTEFACDPTCGGENVMNNGPDQFGNCATGPSYIREDEHVQGLNLTTAMKISTFTWACGKGGAVPPLPVVGEVGYDIELNQKFQEFVTISYYLPLPEAWSFVNGDVSPF